MQKKNPFLIPGLSLFVFAGSVILGAAFPSRVNKSLAPEAFQETLTLTNNGRPLGTWRGDWLIDEPNVKQHITEYKTIRFEPGDKVTIHAGGCAQTGGHGSTWKRYVNPGADNFRLYHGLIWIPGLIGGTAAAGGSPDPKRIEDYVDRALLTVPSDTHLWLGYEDDDYSDNGYWGHDDGTGDQCKGVKNAWVLVSVERRLVEGSEWVYGGVGVKEGYTFKDENVDPRRAENWGVFSLRTYSYTGSYYCYCNAKDPLCQLIHSLIAGHSELGFELSCTRNGTLVPVGAVGNSNLRLKRRTP
jgi:hypothetical protein